MLLPREEVERQIDWDRPFERVNGLPVCIDWERSVLDRERLLESEGASAVSKARQLVELVSRDRPSPTVLVVGGGEIGLGVEALWSLDSLVRGLFRSPKAGHIAKLAVFWLKYLDRAIPESHRIDGACGVYFLGRRQDRELVPREMPTQYLGAG